MFYYSWYDFLFNRTIFPHATCGLDCKKSFTLFIDSKRILVFLKTTGYLSFDDDENPLSTLFIQSEVTDFVRLNYDTIMYTRLKRNYIVQICKDEEDEEDGEIKCFFVGPHPEDIFLGEKKSDYRKKKILQDFAVVKKEN